jgi:hypothetical protein
VNLAQKVPSGELEIRTSSPTFNMTVLAMSILFKLESEDDMVLCELVGTLDAFCSKLCIMVSSKFKNKQKSPGRECTKVEI